MMLFDRYVSALKYQSIKTCIMHILGHKKKKKKNFLSYIMVGIVVEVLCRAMIYKAIPEDGISNRAIDRRQTILYGRLRDWVI